MASVIRKIQFSQLRLLKNSEENGKVNPVKASTIFQKINSLPFVDGQVKNTRYLHTDNGDRVSLQSDTPDAELEVNSQIKGYVGRKRLSNWPMVEHEGKLEGLSLPPGRGLFERSHFVIFEDSLIGYEVNNVAPRLSHVCAYLSEKANELVDEVDYRLLWTRDVAKKIQGVNAVTLFSIRASRDLHEAISRHDRELGQVFQVARNWSNGPMIEITFRVEERKRRGFPLPRLSRIVPLLGDADARQGIEKLWIKAKNFDEHQSRFLDLLQDALISAKSVLQEDDVHKNVDSTSMYNAIISAKKELDPTIELALENLKDE